MDLIQIGPFPEGEDTRHTDLTHLVFQGGPERPPRLSSAENVIIDDTGWIQRRDGLTLRASAIAGKTVFSGAGLLLFQNGGTIKSIDTSTWGTTTLVTGLNASATVTFHEVGGKVFYSDGALHGIITAEGLAQNWGMSVPPSPTLSATTGDLPAGRYRVSCVYLDGNDVMSGAPKAAELSLNGSQDLVVDFITNDSNAAYVRVYASIANGNNLNYVGQLPAGSLPATITDVKESREPLRTQFLQGPIVNIDGVSSWGGMVLTWRDSFIVRSKGNAHHLFDLRTDYWSFDYDIQGAYGIDGGVCWVATTRGLYRVSGNPAEGYALKRMDRRRYAKGYRVESGDKIPALQGITGEVVLFASEDGMVVCLADGQMRAPNEDQAVWDVDGKTASFCYHEISGTKQLLVNLE